MYLVDTSVFLEIFLRRGKSPEAKKFLSQTPYSHLYITDITLYTLGLLLFKHRGHQAYVHLLNDMFQKGEAWRIQLMIENMSKVVEVSQKYEISFNDAYQYAAADLYNLTLVSYNDVFDKTERGRKTPAEVLKEEY